VDQNKKILRNPSYQRLSILAHWTSPVKLAPNLLSKRSALKRRKAAQAAISTSLARRNVKLNPSLLSRSVTTERKVAQAVTSTLTVMRNVSLPPRPYLLTDNDLKHPLSSVTSQYSAMLTHPIFAD
jgi:hypothetical protein